MLQGRFLLRQLERIEQRFLLGQLVGLLLGQFERIEQRLVLRLLVGKFLGFDQRFVLGQQFLVDVFLDQLV